VTAMLIFFLKKNRTGGNATSEEAHFLQGSLFGDLGN